MNSVQNVAFLPLILGLVQLFLQVGMPKKLSPVLAVVLGILAGIFYLAPHDYPTAILMGLSLGLGATGLHSGVKNVTEGIQSLTASASIVATPAPLTPQEAGQKPVPANPPKPTAPAPTSKPAEGTSANVNA